ncbi:DinB family protein [Robertkochia solimangrovi]|uniref:DinB family protein n=1 Tax=Robertkochia solimangrovi TaxID=2213046 RepID=UPI00117CCC6E|nr:DinB family protein [Robertkochia solimangrovi]TRZ45730.1 damage-inducible protein DinB [Robertkochia solimangrovi]
MKELFTDIFEYHHHFNQKLIAVFIAHVSDISDRSIPTLSHIINAHTIWNCRVQKMETPPLNQLHSLEESAQLDLSNYNYTMQILDQYELEEIIHYSNSRGNSYENTIRDILFHVNNHTTHHRGQLISDLRLNGIEPFISDYIFWKR